MLESQSELQILQVRQSEYPRSRGLSRQKVPVAVELEPGPLLCLAKTILLNRRGRCLWYL